MVRIDRILAKTLKKLSAGSYNDWIYYESDTDYIKNLTTKDIAILRLRPEDIPESIDRLADSGYVRIRERDKDGNCSISVTSRCNHWFAFWFDAFTKKFWGGYILGVLSSITASLIVYYITGAFRG